MKNQRLMMIGALGVVAAIIASLTPSLVSAQSVSPSTNATPVVLSSGVAFFENITLTSPFTPDPAVVRGISGGDVPAEEVAGRPETATGACIGFIDSEPDHRMTLNTPFQLLSLRVQATDDTTLVVRGPGGVWCNDSYTDWNPGIVGQWLSGTYDIWIGSPSQGEYYPYVLEFSETAE